MSTARAASLSRMLFLRLRENRWSKRLERTLRETPPGGVLLAEPLPCLTREDPHFAAKIRRACGAPVFIAIRQEGGECDPLSRYFPALPSPHAAAARGPEAVGRMSGLIGEAMRTLGINTNFAPRLDLASEISEKRIGASALGRDAAEVATCGAAFIRGLVRNKVMACAKHFPGEGSVPAAVEKQLSVSAKPMAALWREDLLPFRRLLPQLPMVLISAAAFKAYDFDIPRAASLSPLVVEGLLRIKLAYRGLALAYDLESERVRGALSFGEAVVKSLSAGCDMVIVDQGKQFETALQAIVAGFESERLSEPRVKESLGRVAAAAKQLPPLPHKISIRAEQNLQKQFRSFAEEFSHA